MYTDHARREQNVEVIGLGAAMGALLWFLMVASVAAGGDADDRFMWFVVVMAVTALVLGLALPAGHRPAVNGLILAPLLAAPWSAPRGDGDGLWIFVFPYLVILAAALMAVAALGHWLRQLAGDR